MGINKIKELMKVMSRNAELPDNKHITNTSVRTTLVQRMTDCNVPDNFQVYVTGHKRTGGKPRNYHEIRLTQICSRATSGTRRGSFQAENWIKKGWCHVHFVLFYN